MEYWYPMKLLLLRTEAAVLLGGLLWCWVEEPPYPCHRVGRGGFARPKIVVDDKNCEIQGVSTPS